MALLVSFPGRYLEGLGSATATSSRLAFTDTADVRAVLDPQQRNATATDGCIVVRTGAAASAGQLQRSAITAFNLPGTAVIVDDPTVVAALSDGGLAATEYLNSTLPMRFGARCMSQRSLPSTICALAAPPRLNERNRCGHGGRAILATGLLEKTAPYGTRWHKIVHYTQWGRH